MNQRNSSRTFFTIGFILLGIILLTFILGLFWTPYNPNATDASCKLAAPCTAHICGTDNLGRDVFSRLLVASRYTVIISITGVLVAFILGTLLGFPAGFYGGLCDRIIMLGANIIMCFPGILLALVAVAVFGPSLYNVVFALGIVFAPTFARIYRTGIMQLNTRDYIVSAKVQKVKPLRIMAVHMFPNLLGQLLPAIVIGLANMTLFESSMSYLGLGVQPPKASFGKMLSDAQGFMTVAPWLLVFPALGLIMYILGLYFVSEGIRIKMGGNEQ